MIVTIAVAVGMAAVEPVNHGWVRRRHEGAVQLGCCASWTSRMAISIRGARPCQRWMGTKIDSCTVCFALRDISWKVFIVGRIGDEVERG